MKNFSPDPGLVFLGISVMIDTLYVKVYDVGDAVSLTQWSSRTGFPGWGMDDD